MAETEVPADAPVAPPAEEEEGELTDAHMLPSQRDKCKYYLPNVLGFTFMSTCAFVP